MIDDFKTALNKFKGDLKIMLSFKTIIFTHMKHISEIIGE